MGSFKASFSISLDISVLKYTFYWCACAGVGAGSWSIELGLVFTQDPICFSLKSLNIWGCHCWCGCRCMILVNLAGLDLGIRA